MPGFTLSAKRFFWKASVEILESFAPFNFPRMETGKSFQYVILYKGSENWVNVQPSGFHGSISPYIWGFAGSTYQSQWRTGKLSQKEQQKSWIMALEERQRKATWSQGSCFICTDFFFTVTISLQEPFYSLQVLLEDKNDSLRAFALPANICLFFPNLMPHTCCFVYKSSTIFFIPDGITGTRKALIALMQKLGNQKLLRTRLDF